MSDTKVTLNTTAEVKAKLRAVTLSGLEFLDAGGRPGAKDTRIVNARLTFIDGVMLTMTRAAFDSLTDDDFRTSNDGHQTANV